MIRVSVRQYTSRYPGAFRPSRKHEGPSEALERRTTAGRPLNLQAEAAAKLEVGPEAG